MQMRLFGLILVAAGFAACAFMTGASVKEILGNPAQYEGKSVTVTGEVVEAANLIVVKYYKLDDGTGQIVVVTKGAVPRRGAKVTATGAVHQAFSIGDESLTVIVEEPR
jgi:hypothetical protein